MTNRQAQVDLDWGDDTYTFRMTVTGAIELEQKCDAPFAVVFKRLMAGEYKVADIRETIRLGLIGGGKTPAVALNLVRKYVDERPIAENILTAQAVLSGLMFGFAEEAKEQEDDPPAGKAEATPMVAPSASTSPASTEPQRSWESPLKPLVRSRFGNSQPL
jgi:hypothetical protein